MKIQTPSVLVTAILVLTAPVAFNAEKPMVEPPSEKPAVAVSEIATLGGGCFWCIEAVFEQIDGVIDVVSGYMGGVVPNPDYRDVCAGTTGHAEVCRITFDPARVSYKELLELFWQAHDPTTLNQQGIDVGSQYRSVIFTHSGEQRSAAKASKAALDASKLYAKPAVTDLEKAGSFYKAGVSHQDYYRNNANSGYCRVMINPKLRKMKLKTR